MGRRGPNIRTQYTCSKLRFCNPEGEADEEAGGRRRVEEESGRSVDKFSQQDVWKLTGKEAFDACDFTDAELMGTTNATSCVEVEKDDLTSEGELSYYASRENCAAGQKIAVRISDWEATRDSCMGIALHIPASSRIRECDCDFANIPFSPAYPKLCAAAYRIGCKNVEMPGDCCATGTCMSKMEVFETPEGREYELQRRLECDDEIPGNCYNINGVASDMSMNGSTDCCSQTCSSCGSELSPGAVFEMCTTNFPNNMTAACGRLSRYSLVDHICDFSECPEKTHWSGDGDAVWKYMGLPKPGDLDPTIDIAIDGGGATEETEAENAVSAAAASASLVIGVVSSTGLVSALL